MFSKEFRDTCILSVALLVAPRPASAADLPEVVRRPAAAAVENHKRLNLDSKEDILAAGPLLDLAHSDAVAALKEYTANRDTNRVSIARHQQKYGQSTSTTWPIRSDYVFKPIKLTEYNLTHVKKDANYWQALNAVNRAFRELDICLQFLTQVDPQANLEPALKNLKSLIGLPGVRQDSPALLLKTGLDVKVFCGIVVATERDTATTGSSAFDRLEVLHAKARLKSLRPELLEVAKVAASSESILRPALEKIFAGTTNMPTFRVVQDTQKMRTILKGSIHEQVGAAGVYSIADDSIYILAGEERLREIFYTAHEEGHAASCGTVNALIEASTAHSTLCALGQLALTNIVEAKSAHHLILTQGDKSTPLLAKLRLRIEIGNQIDQAISTLDRVGQENSSLDEAAAAAFQYVLTTEYVRTLPPEQQQPMMCLTYEQFSAPNNSVNLYSALAVRARAREKLGDAFEVFKEFSLGVASPKKQDLLDHVASFGRDTYMGRIEEATVAMQKDNQATITYANSYAADLNAKANRGNAKLIIEGALHAAALNLEATFLKFHALNYP